MKELFIPDYSNAVMYIQENANGSYTLYEPSYMNVTLSFVFSFSFQNTLDSTKGPLLNAIEIMNVLGEFRSMLANKDLIEEGDPCVPAQWEWVTCSLNSLPRITKIALSDSTLEGEIPSGIKDLQELTELDLLLPPPLSPSLLRDLLLPPPEYLSRLDKDDQDRSKHSSFYDLHMTNTDMSLSRESELVFQQLQEGLAFARNTGTSDNMLRCVLGFQVFKIVFAVVVCVLLARSYARGEVCDNVGAATFLSTVGA
ncbi:Concanavalin A-like lectin/glucanase, subgroup [Artemisia annua]|uniref:Concanavalin A-like lectin/glucanase, subgroup n=1 Tax=Artemisia annua TaxID=35608 RepID=A0A2U1MJI4_ARTAN|nr:Concanavalin A-like lectin/glucanase, subgroup [Artemisia annua]